MQIICPHCGHSREVAEDRLPSGAVRATCPTCRQQFPLDFGREEPVPTAGENQEKTTASPPVSPQPSPAPPSAKEPPPSQGFAGFWIRLIASLVDSFAVALLQAGTAFLFAAFLRRLEMLLASGFPETSVHAWTVLFSLATGIAYYVFFTGYCGQTPGKMALRVKVVGTDGSEIGYGRAFIRETVGKFLSAAIFCVGYLMVAFTRRKQGLHDKLAGTLVVKVN